MFVVIKDYCHFFNGIVIMFLMTVLELHTEVEQNTAQVITSRILWNYQQDGSQEEWEGVQMKQYCTLIGNCWNYDHYPILSTFKYVQRFPQQKV